MNKEMIVYVPQIVIDVAENFAKSRDTSNAKNNYMIRLEAIRDYCNMVLEQDKKNPNNHFRKAKR